jgi:hypothetical protein
LFVFDMAFDCESEGFIRFREPKFKKVGMFNHLGQMAIPAEYDGLTHMRNGLAVGIKGAKTEALGEHSMLVGGVQYLIDSYNTILVDSFETVEGLDYYSLKIENSPSPDTCRLNYKGRNGKYYTFIDNKKRFRQWLFSEFMTDLSQQNLIKQAHTTISLSQKNTNKLGKSNFIIHKHYDLIRSRIAEIKTNKDCHLFIDSYMDEHLKKDFETYYDNCGDLNTTKYPAITYILNYHQDKDFYQNLFTFLKTEAGFKLISLTIRD